MSSCTYEYLGSLCIVTLQVLSLTIDESACWADARRGTAAWIGRRWRCGWTHAMTWLPTWQPPSTRPPSMPQPSLTPPPFLLLPHQSSAPRCHFHPTTHLRISSGITPFESRAHRICAVALEGPLPQLGSKCLSSASIAVSLPTNLWKLLLPSMTCAAPRPILLMTCCFSEKHP